MKCRRIRRLAAVALAVLLLGGVGIVQTGQVGEKGNDTLHGST